jgi:hypothetical protein
VSRPKGPGRPRLPNGMAKESVLALRVTAADRAAIDAAAERGGMPVTKWARKILLSSADSLLRIKRD